MKKNKLPKNWVIVSSKSHPDRVYYFNTRTNESSWNKPNEDEINKTLNMEIGKTRKRKTRGGSPIELRRKTPDLEDEKKVNNNNNKSNVRERLVAKRLIKPAQNVDTPQMIELKRKIELKKNKSNCKNNSFVDSTKSDSSSIKSDNCFIKSKPNDSSNITSSRRRKSVIPETATSKLDKSETSTSKSDKQETATSKSNKPETSTSKSDKPETVTSKPETMTPQMRVIYEKLREKNAKKKDSKLLEPINNAKDIDVIDNIQSKIKDNKNRRSTKNTRKSIWKCSGSNQITSPNSSGFGYDLTENINKNLMTNSTRKKSLEESNVNITQNKKLKLTETTDNKTSIVKTVKQSRSEIFQKNVAKDRMERLRKSLNVQTKDHKNLEFPDVYKTSDMRHRNIRNRLLRNKIISNEDQLIKSVKTDLQNTTFNTLCDDSINKSTSICEDSVNKSSSTCEEMDWEPLEDEEITFEVQAARIQLYTKGITNETLPIEGNILQFPSREEKKMLYIVVDTNVFLSNLNGVVKAMGTDFVTYNRPVIVVPWTIIRELDYLKSAKSKHKLHEKSRKAIQFLNNHFSAKDPQIVGQTLQDVMNNREKFAAECPDDEILQVCLQIREAGSAVALLSYDKNLCNKAMISDILALGRDDPLEKIDYIFSAKKKSLNYHDISSPRIQSEDLQILSSFQEELFYSNELFEEVGSMMKEFLSVIVSKEMKNLYGETWEKYTIIKPPWTILCVLQCVIKHWIAATSEAFAREALNFFKELLEMFKTFPKGGRRLEDIVYLLEKCSDLTQMINIDKYPELMTRALNAIQDLRTRCQSYENEICEKKLIEKIGMENDENEQIRRAENAFSCFNDAYSYARDFGGMAANIVGMPTSFSFQISNQTPAPEYVKNIQSELSRNTSHLLRALTNALEEMEDSCVDHKTLINLYQILKNFLPERMLSTDFSPLDLYCCLKIKEGQLKQGIKQLEDLCIHYCKLASYTNM